jgi:hypothetical protein
VNEIWTVVNRAFSRSGGEDAWAHLASGNAWRRIAPNSSGGVTNVFAILVAAKANNMQAYVVLNAANQIAEAYL